MGSRQYGQACSLAYALDRIGERWTLLIVRELSLGPMRFSALVRAVGGAPTDILTKRLRELEQHGVIARRELEPPASATVYELTELGRGLERPMVELGRWGMGLQELEDVIELAPSSLPSAIRVILQPPTDFEATLGLRTSGEDYWLRIEDGWTTIGAGRCLRPRPLPGRLAGGGGRCPGGRRAGNRQRRGRGRPRPARAAAHDGGHPRPAACGS